MLLLKFLSYWLCAQDDGCPFIFICIYLDIYFLFISYLWRKSMLEPSHKPCRGHGEKWSRKSYGPREFCAPGAPDSVSRGATAHGAGSQEAISSEALREQLLTCLSCASPGGSYDLRRVCILNILADISWRLWKKY